MEYKRPAGAYPLHDFHKIRRACTTFQDGYLLKFRWICSRGYGIMGVLSWQGLAVPKFSAPPSGDTMRQTPKSFRGAKTCSRSSITMPSLVGLGFHPPLGRPKTLRFFVCLHPTENCKKFYQILRSSLLNFAIRHCRNLWKFSDKFLLPHMCCAVVF